MSTNITHLTPIRHRLNLTIRGNVFVRQSLIEGSKTVGVEAESGGETFRIESDSVVLSAGALKSPHILMLSGIGPKDQLEQFGIPVVQDLTGVSAQLWNHPQSSVSFRVKDGMELASNVGALRFGLRVTSEPPSQSNDVMLQTLGVFAGIIQCGVGRGRTRRNSPDILRLGAGGRRRLAAVGLR